MYLTKDTHYSYPEYTNDSNTSRTQKANESIFKWGKHLNSLFISDTEMASKHMQTVRTYLTENCKLKTTLICHIRKPDKPNPETGYILLVGV